MITIESLVEFVQTKLRIKSDGIIGTETKGAIDKKCRTISAIGDNWPVQRKIIGYVQYIARLQGIDAGKIDGYLGEQTRYAYTQLLHLEVFGEFAPTWRTDLTISATDRVNQAAMKWPTYHEMESYFGKPGTNLITVNAPYAMQLAWNPAQTVKRYTCHKKVAASLSGILESLRDHYGLEKIQALGLDQFGGIYNYRKMRGGDKLSTHAWGVPIDLDPNRNRLKWNHKKARFATPEYAFMRDAFRKEGWTSLGEEKDYDWMHFQPVRL